MNPRPDQIAKIKNLGMITSGTDLFFYEGRAQRIIKDYGERAVEWIVPRKRLIEAGVMNSQEIDRPIGYTKLTYFSVLHSGITRKDMNGNVAGANLTLDRESMLKVATIWGANYAMREDKLGSLEPGKWADIVVLDRDYLTIPIDDIPNIRVLMTLVGGKTKHLVPSFAREIGMQPTGSQVELGADAAQW